MDEFKRENKYLVLKWDDIHRYLTKKEENEVFALADKISRNRAYKGYKPSNNYVVVNESEPYAELVWQLIESGHGEHVFVPKGEGFDAWIKKQIEFYETQYSKDNEHAKDRIVVFNYVLESYKQHLD